ncbi:uncharacterized protein DS421_19g670890 [Arachis hypogaea]|uniref:Uncharacterized protein n=1 Tax=Arachis hypogaea TaxID=3818 RepID=A0A6B9VFM4_ARAHY|nr:uncharacterized protein DS421_19g670890 [Arachis hypogaea]
MLESSSQGSGSSSRARSHGGWVKNAHQVGMFRIGAVTTDKRWCGFFKWADVEEEEVIVGRNESSSGVGTNFINSAKRADVLELAPCFGSTLKVIFLLDCSLSGFVTYCRGGGGGGGGSDGGT